MSAAAPTQAEPAAPFTAAMIQMRTSLSPEECLVIEDSPPGVRAARGAGLRTLGVTNTVGEKELRAAGAEVVTPNLSDWVTDAVHHLYDAPPAAQGKSEV